MDDIGPATREDVDQLMAAENHPAAREHLRARWELHSRGEALFLLARRDGAIVGHTMLLRQSKYPAVQTAYNPAEINALHAYTQGQGIGTAIVAAAEEIARRWGRKHIGLAVGLDNPNARRLYERLGYRQWVAGQVLDEWTEKDADSNVIVTHRDPCDYLLKPLPNHHT
jgi:GNAT superfamily N-acetyltransferase